MRMKGLCVRLCCTVIGFFLLATCHYSPPGLTAEGPGKKTKDSLVYLFRYHYIWNMNLKVLDDSIWLEYPPVKDAYVSLNKGDRVVVTEFSIHSQDNADSIWAKLTHSQDVQGRVRNRDLVRSFVPIDSISQLIHLFSNTHASYFIIIFALSVGTYLLRAFMEKQLQMVYLSNIGNVYPLFLCLLMVFSVTVYETMQVFIPDIWEHFCFNPALSPFKVPPILSVSLLSIWLFIVATPAVLDDLFRQLIPAAAVFYLLGLMSCCILCYFFFVLATYIYIGYLFLACFIWLFMKKVRRNSGYKYRCGNRGQKLREKGIYPHCGVVNE